MSERLAISLKHVNKDFRLPHEKPTGIKQAIIKFKPGKKYEVQRVLRDVSFEVKEGEFFGIVGRNGSGKSTLLKILAQIYVPNKGKVTVNGSLTPFIELGVGFNAELTGRENVYLNGALLGFDRKQMDEIYDDIVDFAEIGRFMDQKLKNYSSGMQVRLAFSIAIRANSDILLIDEVLAVGDAAFQQKCFDYFEELKRRKRTVVLVTHDMAAVRRFCTRAIYLKDSRLILDGSVQEIADLYLEENINVNDGEATTEEKTKTDQPAVECKILGQSTSELSAEISFDPKNLVPSEYYVGFSVMFDGMSVAERNSLHSDKNAGFNASGTIKITLPLTNLNAGVYQLSAAVFKKNNKELIASTTKRPQFVIKGNDESLGGAMRLPDVWR